MKFRWILLEDRKLELLYPFVNKVRICFLSVSEKKLKIKHSSLTIHWHWIIQIQTWTIVPFIIYIVDFFSDNWLGQHSIPENCTGVLNCQYLLIWSVPPEGGVKFEIWMKNSNSTTLGFSTEKLPKMVGIWNH